MIQHLKRRLIVIAMNHCLLTLVDDGVRQPQKPANKLPLEPKFFAKLSNEKIVIYHTLVYCSVHISGTILLHHIHSSDSQSLQD